MYKSPDKSQSTFLDFNQPLGLHMNPNNRWIEMADLIPWDIYEQMYADMFPSNTGNVAKPLRLALGCLIIQKRYDFSDRELVEQLTENPYYQYFIGLPGYQQEPPIDASTLVDFRKRLSFETIQEANEYMLAAHKEDKENDDDNEAPPTSGGKASEQDTPESESGNKGTLLLDATCAPSNIRYPQDFSLLNEARVKVETIIIRFCKSFGLPFPRMYRRQARKNFLRLAKSRNAAPKRYEQPFGNNYPI